MGSTEGTVRPAAAADRDALVAMMTEFYGESGFAFDRDEAAGAFARVLGDPRLGRVWVIEDSGAPAGYLVMTLGFSMEFGGRSAFLDDFFLRPAFRGRGLGRTALAALRAECRELGVKVVYLETAADNARAVALYREVGFVERKLVLMVLPLEPALHERA